MCNQTDESKIFFKKIENNDRAIDAVRKLHRRRFSEGLFCMHCHRRYPCQTIQILGEKNDSNASGTTYGISTNSPESR
jgi:hypothetical protein